MDIREQSSWIDEDGNKVEILPFFDYLYSDSISINLSRNYNIYQIPRGIGGLGETELETAASSLMELCYTVHSIVGVESKQLDKVGNSLSTSCLFGRSWDYNSLKRSGHIREKKIAGHLVLFPTEKLVEKAFDKQN